MNAEDFAKFIGTSRNVVVSWIKGEAVPDRKNRERLALASGGRYTPSDFIDEKPDPVAELNELMQTIALRVQKLDQSIGKLSRRLEALDASVQALSSSTQTPQAVSPEDPQQTRLIGLEADLVAVRERPKKREQR